MNLAINTSTSIDHPRRLVILAAQEPDSQLMQRARGWAQALSVHVYAFNPARDQAAYEAWENLLLQRLRGASAFQIGWIAAYLLLGRRGSALAKLFPPPAQARGVIGWFWRWQIGRILSRRCVSLSIPPLAFVAVDPVARSAARCLSRRYRCPVYTLDQTDAISTAVTAAAPERTR
jgi:hypothetical protein